jgi:serine/threonine-protein kinase
LSLSPDEKHVAVSRLEPAERSGRRSIWILDLTAGGSATRFTFDDGTRRFPLWSPDNKRILSSDHLAGVATLYEKPPEGGTEQVFATGVGQPTSWSQDGKNVVYQVNGDIWVLSGGKSIQITKAAAIEGQAQFSPDGRWIAYGSDETKRNEIWVQSFPGAKRWQVSTAGGVQPRWSGNGNELFYVDLDHRLMAVRIKSGSSFEYDPPAPLFRMSGSQTSLNLTFSYAVGRDGKRFLVRTPADRADAPINIITNWAAFSASR